MLSNTNPTSTPAWSNLSDYFAQFNGTVLTELFKNNHNRVKELSIDFYGHYVDFSKNLIDQKVISLFKSLGEEMKLDQAKNALFSGEKINATENRAVLHTALRYSGKNPIIIDGENIVPWIQDELNKIKHFTENLHNGELLGYTGKPIKNIINIGIGGSDLGPYMVTKALKPFWKKGITPYFVSNIDASDILETVEKVDPETTLFIIASKTFTTQETMTNAETARNWFLKTAKDQKHISKHFVAVSTNKQKVTEFGIDPANMFIFWDWVGGRYSLWSSIGLSIACAVGFDNFKELLKGAEEMDEHFLEAPFEKNIPTLMACLGIWYNNFYGAETHAVLPYDHLLSYFSKYLQQGDMESNGKFTDRAGNAVNYQTGQIIWGEPGTNGQHAFYQLIHQGTKMIPCDFIAAAQPPHNQYVHHKILIANFIAQTEALMKGKSAKEVKDELIKSGLSNDEIQKLLPYKVFAGNKPTTTILLQKLSPRSLGSLIAMYEHKIFVQGIIWNVFSFDQWGVELGKQLAGNVLKDLDNDEASQTHDPSTKAIIDRFLNLSRS